MNVSIENFADELKPFLLQDVAICTDKKVIRKGKLRIFQMKQHYAKLTLEDEIRTRLYEIPYPYEMYSDGRKLTLSYKLDKFLNFGELDMQVKFLDSTKKSKLYDSNVYILPLEDVQF